MALLEAENISVSFDNNIVIKDISIHLEKGELVSILGLSGSGKTTLFNVISGLIKPDTGKITFENKDITGTSGHVSYMLQKDLLLPFKTIVNNVALPLILQGVPKKEARQTAASYFHEFGLDGTENKYPKQLSGGMRQRAALLRTYLFSDKVALLDEPFSALDTITKSNLHEWYMDIMDKIQLSTLFITHDIDEAILLSDRVCIIGDKPGRITDEIIIEKDDVRHKDLLLSDNFLKYKKSIINAIGDGHR